MDKLCDLLDIRPGVTALIGGGGKTTLCNLIPRFYEVTDGRILIDGQDIQHVTLKSLREDIGIVQQDVYLFSGSVADNIAYGKPDAPTKRSSPRPRLPMPTALSAACRRATTRSSPRTAATSARARSSCSASPVSCSACPPC